MIAFLFIVCYAVYIMNDMIADLDLIPSTPPVGKLIATRGIPGCGKSTWAMEFVAEDPENRVRVNRDDFRMAFFGQEVLSGAEEVFLTPHLYDVIRFHLRRGKTVVSDDTNLRLAFLRELFAVAVDAGADFEIRTFDTPLEVALERNASRAAKGGRFVPVEVIENMYKKFTNKGVIPFVSVEQLSLPKTSRWVPYVADESLPKAFIFDIDGTYSELNGRDPYDYSRVLEDGVKEQVALVARMLRAHGYKILVTSGRDDCCMQDTLTWFRTKVGLEPDLLLMRSTGDRRQDAVIKHELFNNHIRDNYNVRGVFDDRDQVVALWREMGLFCAQVDYGDF